MSEVRYERRLRKGGEYLYDIKQDKILILPEVCKLLNENNRLIEEIIGDLDD